MDPRRLAEAVSKLPETALHTRNPGGMTSERYRRASQAASAWTERGREFAGHARDAVTRGVGHGIYPAHCYSAGTAHLGTREMSMRPSPPRSAFLIAFVALLAAVQFPATAEDQLVVWTNRVNVSVDSSGTVLQKTGGCDGCDDAGATSEQTLTAGDGYVEFTVGEANTFWMAGLSHGNDGTTFSDIDFAFRFNGGGWADVLENGVYRSGGDTPYVSGDVFRVAVVNGRVQYSRNGVYLMESPATPQYPLLLDVALGTIGATVRNARIGVFPPPPAGGGFLEKAGSPALRARYTRTQIEAFLPAAGAKGPFTFPAPYNTSAVRLTNAQDCGGQDCLWYVGYSYWRNMNNHAGSADMYIFLGTKTNRGGQGPILLRYNKVTDEVHNLGPLFPAGNPWRRETGEGWYFSASAPSKLYVYRVGSKYLQRFDILTRTFDAGTALNLNSCPKPSVCPSDAAYITQPHSSDDDRTHSATVQNSSWQRIGCVVRASTYQYYAPAPGYALDECHVDKSGRWLMLIEVSSSGSRINRVVNLATRAITTIQDVAGALGHLDMGHGYAVGADTYNALPNATILLKFPVTSTRRPIGPVVHYNKRWDIAAANHIAHGNAVAGVVPEDQYACGSNASRVPDMADEVVCFSLDPNRNSDGSLDVLVLGQVMTDLNAIGGDDGSGDYAKLPKGNMDVTGRYFLWTTNLGCDRLDAVLVKIPAERLRR